MNLSKKKKRFTTIVEKLLPKEYFSPNLIGSRLDQLVFTTLVSQKLPALYQVWQQYHLDINIVLCQWFISIYINVLPVEVKRIESFIPFF